MPVNRERQLIRKEVGTLSVKYDRLSDILKNITELIKQHGPDATVEEEVYPYSDSTYLAIYANIPETDKEYDDRISREEQSERMQEKRDRAEYERLKKRFEK